MRSYTFTQAAELAAELFEIGDPSGMRYHTKVGGVLHAEKLCLCLLYKMK